MMKIDNEPSGAPIRVGIIGFGNAGRLIHVPLISSTPEFAVTAISSSRADVVRAALPDVAVYGETSDMLEASDIDLIVVATPPESHVKWASAALVAGKHVLVEKPFTITLSEAAALIDLSRLTGKLLSVFQNRRFDSCFQSVRAVIESGALGRINHYESQYNRFNQTINDAWRAPEELGSGLWYDTGPHVIDQMIQLFGLPTSIHASLAHNRPGSAADDWCHAVLQYPEMRAVLHCSMLVSGGVPRFTVHGDKATVIKQVADGQGRQLWSGVSPDAENYGLDDDAPILFTTDGLRTAQPTWRGNYRLFFEALGAAIRGEAPNPTSARDVLGVMAVLEAGIISAREERVMTIALPEGIA
ncbi:Gfo/Idh/MocA family oxidoreductase [Sphingobium sp. AP50]|uniref:Gfo/Idh/MocA family oxidoreductase n=1 Tax=Sphingobium sp. AP50 TaxID=1884369 RepID=UPI0015A682C8|nr:Gfo/Idh/MocA family oxidoreductase [Sphingobium sp. AP50]